MSSLQAYLRPLGLCLAAALLAGCFSAPVRNGHTETWALPPTDFGLLSDTSRRIGAELDPDESAFWLLDRADFSFHARLALVDHAMASLDVQYFIWEKDPTSRLFAHRIIKAADRGIRVRILLDDLTLNGQDGEFWALNSHANIEVRTFNPWNARSNIGRAAEFFMRSTELNHRMHNKIVVADNQFAIIGGRNIGDRYFGVWEEFVQNDLDILASGPIVGEVSSSFDLYWNSDDAYPLADVIRRRSFNERLDDTAEYIEQVYLNEREKLAEFPLETANWDSLFETLSGNYNAGVGVLEQDLPTLTEAGPTQLNAPLMEFLEQANSQVLLSSPYLVPDEEFADMLARLESRGVQVVILTNSLASNNHMVAHTAYKRWRRRLLEIGVELYEARDDSTTIEYYAIPPTMPAYLGLHTKAAVVDGRYSFIGSPNIDPRSLILNTELAFFIDSPELAEELSALIERDMAPDAAWEVTLTERNKLSWTSSSGTVERQPALSLKQRLTEFFINMLPLKDQV